MLEEDKILYINDYKLTMVNVYYCLPDYKHLINEFWWQTLDLPPEFDRVRKFLKFWHTNLKDAPIHEVEIYTSDKAYQHLFKVDDIINF